MATWAIEAHSKVPPTDSFFVIALDFVENRPLLYLPSGYYSELKPETRFRCTFGGGSIHVIIHRLIPNVVLDFPLGTIYMVN